MTEPDPVGEDWERFQAVTSMTNHWDRPGWRPGRRAYHWFLTFDGEDALVRLAADCQHALADIDYLDPIPRDGLHLTVSRLGFTDEITATDTAAILARVTAAARGLPRFDLTVGPLSGSDGAVRFTVTPWAQLRTLHTIVRDAAAARGLPVSDRPFRPHIGIAYSGRNRPAGPLVSRVAALRHRPPATVSVNDLRLIELYRDGPTYRWNTTAIVPLSTACVTSPT